MSLINCNKNCLYQKEGYCKLNRISSVSNLKSGDCCHYIPNKIVTTKNIVKNRHV